MQTKKKTEEPEERVNPFKHPVFGRRAVAIGDIEFQRKFEQSYVRMSQAAATPAAEPDEQAASGASAETSPASVGTTTPSSCNWQKTGSVLNYPDGNVGIANGAPSEKLDVAGSINASASLKVGGVALPGVYKLDDLGTPDDNTDLNVSTARHGLFPKLPNDTMKLWNGAGAWVEIAEAAGAIHVRFVASATVRNENADPRITTSVSYVKLKEVRLDEPVKEGVRIKFWLLSGTHTEAVRARIYRNGVAIGVERETDIGIGDGEDFSEDFTATWDAGDLIQIYARRTAWAASAEVSGMQFSYDRAITGFGSWNLATGLVTSEQTTYVMTNQDPA